MLTGLPWDKLIWLCVHQARQDAWEEFVRRYHPDIAGGVTRIARQRGVNAPGIEDMVQEVYLKLCERKFRILREFQDDSENGLHAFLRVVSANVARDRCDAIMAARRGGGKVVSLSGAEETVPAEGNVSKGVLGRLFLEEVAHLLRRFAAGPSASRDESIFWLYYRQGLTAREIAALPVVELSDKGVESLLHRLVCQVRSELIRPTEEKSAKGSNTSRSLV